MRAVAIALFAACAPLWMGQVQSLLIHNGLKHTVFSTVLAEPSHVDFRFRAVSGGPYSVTVRHPAFEMDSKKANDL